jgi:hypothetical protein
MDSSFIAPMLRERERALKRIRRRMERFTTENAVGRLFKPQATFQVALAD